MRPRPLYFMRYAIFVSAREFECGSCDTYDNTGTSRHADTAVNKNAATRRSGLLHPLASASDDRTERVVAVVSDVGEIKPKSQLNLPT